MAMISKADNLPKVLLFDLGGVIVPSIGMEVMAEYNDITRAEVSDKFDASEFTARLSAAAPVNLIHRRTAPYVRLARWRYYRALE